MNSTERFAAVCSEMTELYKRKNHDYGDSFHVTYLEEGMAMARIRLSDKLNRMKILTSGKERAVHDESVRDTLLDLACYSVMTVMELDRKKGTVHSDGKKPAIISTELYTGIKDSIFQSSTANESGSVKGVRGAFRLECCECGSVFGTFLREYRKDILCRCGHRIDLDATLTPYSFTCPACKTVCWGRTNLEDDEITVKCRCRESVTLRWNPETRDYRN